MAVVGGLAIVIVTSPQSWQYGPEAWIQAFIHTPTPFPTAVPPTLTPTAVPDTPTVAATAHSTSRVTPTLGVRSRHRHTRSGA